MEKKEINKRVEEIRERTKKIELLERRMRNWKRK